MEWHRRQRQYGAGDHGRRALRQGRRARGRQRPEQGFVGRGTNSSAGIGLPTSIEGGLLMKSNRIRPRSHRTIASAGVLAILASGTAFTTAARAEEAITDPWKVDVYYENDTHFRGKDKTGETVGLSKFRNTLQVEADKRFGGGWAFHGILRGTWDGVYRMNADQYGNSAGSRSASDVQLQNTAGPVAASVGAPLPPQYLTATVPFGGGVGFTVVDALQAAAGLPNLGGPGGGPGINRFVDSYGPNNPGTGLRLLGDRWHGTSNSGVEFAVPVRPCDKDSRGCVDFGGYGDKKLSELEAPEFNDRLDFVQIGRAHV